MRRRLRLVGTVLAVTGLLAVAWTLVVWQWQDPFTALYTLWKQHQLAAQYAKRASACRATYGPEHDPRRRHRSRLVDEGAGPRPRQLHAGREPARLHRRPSDDLPRPVLAYRPDAQRRS